VAVTGIGVVTSLGVGKKDNWEALTAGKSGIHPITRFPVDQLNTRIAGTVDFLASSSKGASALTYELAETAAGEAITEAGFTIDDFGGPLFLASPPVELDWHDRLALYKGGDREPASDRLLEVARNLNSLEMFDSGWRTVSARPACRSRFPPPAHPARPPSSSASRRSGAARRSARSPSVRMARPQRRR
jgi:3-oxoacyl-[acyl-carrier-protein] synthase II